MEHARNRLGASPVEVTRFGFGSAPLGEHKVLVPEHDAQETLALAWQAGLRYFDTAPFYGYGLAEHRTGHFLRQHPRTDYVMSSKVGRWLRPRDANDTGRRVFKGGLEYEPVVDYSYGGTLRSVEQTLQRTGLARLDVVLIHDCDIWTHGTDGFPVRFEEAMQGAYRALRELRREGLVGAVGVGLNDVASCLAFAERGEFDCMMLAGRYTLLNHEALDRLLPLCARQAVSLLIAAPFNSGILASGAVEGAMYDYRPATPAVLDKVRRIEMVCAEHAVPLAAAALQFPLGHASVASVVSGAAFPHEIASNTRLMEYPIPPEFWQALRREGLLRDDVPIPAA